MSFQRFGRRRMGRGRSRSTIRPVDSNKNVVDFSGSTGTTIVTETIAKAVDSAALTAQDEVTRGCTINNIWLSLDVCGLAGTGVLQITALYIFKNPGTNLTPPGPFFVGTSNEKKFVFKQWSHMTMRNQDGNDPIKIRQWIKVPKVYRRMGADDLITISLIVSSAAGHYTGQCIYKWYK